MLTRLPLSLARLRKADQSAPYTVIAMRHHPRNVSASLRDEYCGELAPQAALFTEFKARERASGDHNAAFAEVDYERRFWLEAAGLVTLARLIKLGADHQRDIALVCQCQFGHRCHVDLLLMMAKTIHLAETAPIALTYPIFQRRLDAWVAPF